YGQTGADAAVAQQVASTIKESGQLSNYRLGVKYQDGVAWLLRTVTSQGQMDAAVALAEQVEGVSHVICKLEIDSRAATRPAATPPRESQGMNSIARQQESIEQPKGDTRVTPAAMQAASQRPMRQAPAGRVAQAGG